MNKKQERKIRQILARASDRHHVWMQLRKQGDPRELISALNSYPTANRRRLWGWLSWLAVFLLLLLTIKQVYRTALLFIVAVSAGQFTPVLLLELVVPAINFYLLNKLISMQRQGFLFLAILMLLALFRPENRLMPDMALSLVLAGTGALLYFCLFPRKELLQGCMSREIVGE